MHSKDDVVKKAGKGFPFTQDTVYIEFRTGFMNDTITIYRNDTEFIIKDILTTDESLGFSDRFLVPKKGLKNLTIVDGTQMKQVNFIDSLPSFLFIKKEQDTMRISFQYSIPKLEYK